MSHRLSFLDRLLVGVVGVLALGAGAWAILWALDQPLGHTLAAYVSLEEIERFMATPWYPLTLILVVLLTLGLSLWLLVANLRRHPFNRLTAGENNAVNA